MLLLSALPFAYPYCGLLLGACSHELGKRGDEVSFWSANFHSSGSWDHSISFTRPSLNVLGCLSRSAIADFSVDVIKANGLAGLLVRRPRLAL
jgi:hypothetical protein